jgi:hypothetical protein
MSTRNDYSVDEWNAISTAPVAAALVVSLAAAGCRPGTVDGILRVGRTIIESALVGAPEIAIALAESMKNGTDRPARPEIHPMDRAGTQAALIDSVRIALHAIEMKSPIEVDPFKAWLAAITAKVSHAVSPEMRDLQISRDVHDTINCLADVLGVTRDSRGHLVPSAEDTAAAQLTVVPLAARFTRMSNKLLIGPGRGTAVPNTARVSRNL